MKTLAFVGTVVALLWAGTAFAFHGTGLVCSKCHTMHYSEGNSLPTNADSGGPFKNLLLKSNSSQLCLVCHDGQSGTPDVVGADVNGLTERAAGFFAAVDQVNANGHNLNPGKLGSSQVCVACHFGGDFNTAKIGCVDCHDPHGRDPGSANYRWRNLQWASSPGSEPILKAFIKSGVTGVNAYDRSNIGYGAPSGGATWREVSNVCLDCHHTFSGYNYTREGGAESGHPIRHPVTDSERGAYEPINKFTGSTDPTHWVGGTGYGFSIDRLPFVITGATDYTSATTVAQDNEVFCLTCHKAHGSSYANSLRWDYNTTSNEGCQQCHNKG